MIPFNKPFLAGKEIHYIYQAVYSGKISGNGQYTKLCQNYFHRYFGFQRCLLTTSCTSALEMAAILVDIQPGDEVIMPSFTFVSTANAFVLRGARLVFADSGAQHPNMDVSALEELVTPRTKAIVVMHYGGMACDMDAVMELANRKGLWVVEDAAQAVDSYYKGKVLGSIGHLSAFSFHETKNVISGEGGMLAINDPRFEGRAEIIWEKGTNRASFFRGEVDKYNWQDIGSSYLPSEIVAAFLYAQLENLEMIQQQRRRIWDRYWSALAPLATAGLVKLPEVPPHATCNGHLFYLLCHDLEERQQLISYLRTKDIYAAFHYVPLHSSPFYHSRHGTRVLPNADYYGNTLVRLPLFYELTDNEQEKVICSVTEFYSQCA